MERHQTPTHPFEVWCDSCRTSFAVGTKRCIHCGGRLSKRGGRRALRVMRMDQQVELPEEIDDVLIEEGPAPGRKSFSPLTLVWVAVLLGGYLFQLCSQR
ncbi:MAG: hypothetical protein ACR2P8_02855 [Myxococcota bacterium]